MTTSDQLKTVSLPDGQLRIWKQDEVVNCLGRMYVLDVLGVCVHLYEREDGTYVHVDQCADSEPTDHPNLLVEVNNTGEFDYSHPDAAAAPTTAEGMGPGAEMPELQAEAQESTAHPAASTPVQHPTRKRAERLYHAMLEAAGEFGGEGMSSGTDDALRALAQIIVAEG